MMRIVNWVLRQAGVIAGVALTAAAIVFWWWLIGVAISWVAK